MSLADVNQVQLAGGRLFYGVDTSTLGAANQISAAPANTIEFRDQGATDSIALSSGTFVADGYVVGMSIVVAGSANNDGEYPILALTAAVATVAGGSLVGATPVNNGVTLNGVAAAPYGGTELGLVSSVFVIPPAGVLELPAEEFGGASCTLVYTGGDAVAGALMVNWTDDTVALFPGAGTGGDGGPIVTFPAKVGEAALQLTNLMHAPTNPLHNAWLMPLATPAVDDQARLQFSHRRWLNYPVIFRSQPDGAGRALVVGKLADLAGL